MQTKIVTCLQSINKVVRVLIFTWKNRKKINLKRVSVKKVKVRINLSLTIIDGRLDDKHISN